MPKAWPEGSGGRRLRWMGPAAIVLTLLGCGQGPGTAPVSGVVQFDGVPVTQGTVSFYPVAGGRPATGKLGPGGAFELSTFGNGDGALLGGHKVTISAMELINAPPPPKSLSEEISQSAPPPKAGPKARWIVPEKYSAQATSGLTATVVGGTNLIEFDLP
ncbi:hypothetical protein Pla123a_32030 [Posidoniimonas polymericola]|uniref:Carboxypeptidase regulatory-like domain-containing protein n=2 Tax=Posidoniimonas polymericola TaxID=2528002 RepID=A0A5C5YL84_9BACT|nr:hypothetical protein Pla123a_32030 [Posidoniimonas polymericola]